MLDLDTIALLELGSNTAEEVASALAELGFTVRRHSDVPSLTAVADDTALVLLPDGPRAPWALEQVRRQPALLDLPLLGIRPPRATAPAEWEPDAWLTWPDAVEVVIATLREWLARAEARGAQGQFDETLRQLALATAPLVTEEDLDRALPAVLRAASRALDAGAVLVVCGRSESDAYVVATHEATEGFPAPLDEAAALAVHNRLVSGQPTQCLGPEGDGLIGRVLDRDEGSDPLQSVTLPIVLRGQALGGLLLTRPAERPGLSPAQVHAGEHLAHVLALVLRQSLLVRRLRDQTQRISLPALDRLTRRKALDRYLEYFESATDGIVVVEPDGKIVHMNRAAGAMTGYSPEGVVGRAAAELLARHSPDDARRLLDRILSGDLVRPFDLALRTTSGDELTAAVSASALKLEPPAVVFTFRDVTEARAIAAELYKTKDFLERLIDAAVDAVVAADQQTGRILLFNRGAERLFRRSAEAAMASLTLAELFPVEDHDDLVRQLHSPQHGGVGRLEPTQKQVVDSEGRHIPVSLTAGILHEDGRESAVVAVITDLREQISIRERLAIAQEKLEVTEKQALIAELAGTTAHELNQPLTSVMGYAELLLRKTEPEDPRRHALQVLVREAERMAEIVRKIGQITRYETKSYVGSTQILDLDRSTGK
jgi:PAS domain S-box-containing protein